MGWNIAEVIKYGKKHGYPEGDIYGSLYFYLRDEFRKFANRIQSMNITIHFTNQSAQDLCLEVAAGEHEPFGEACFDRIETSNLADYLGIPRILQDWGPLLSKANKHAALLIYLMNWKLKEKNSAYEFCDPRKFEGNTRASLIRRLSILVSECSTYRSMHSQLGRGSNRVVLEEWIHRTGCI